MGYAQQIRRSCKCIGQASIRVTKTPPDLGSCFGVDLIRVARHNDGKRHCCVRRFPPVGRSSRSRSSSMARPAGIKRDVILGRDATQTRNRELNLYTPILDVMRLSGVNQETERSG